MESELRTNAKHASPEQQYQIRKNIVRLLQSGMKGVEIANTLDVSAGLVSEVKKACAEKGIAGIKAKKHGRKTGEKRKLTPEQEREIQRSIVDNLLAANQRVEGFCGYMSQNRPEMEVLHCDQILGNDQQAYKVTRGLLESRSDIRALFVQSSSKRGVCKAVVDMGKARDLRIFSSEPSQSMLDLLQDGTIDFCIEGDLFSHGYMAVKILFDLLFYERRPKSEFVEISSSIRIAENS